MADIEKHTGETNAPSDSAKADEADTTEAGKAKKMEDVQKEAAVEREEEGGYQ